MDEQEQEEWARHTAVVIAACTATLFCFVTLES